MAKPGTIDEYIASFAPQVRDLLERIRATIRRAAPGAEETISYRIPAFRQNGMLVYFAVFKSHIGFYPPVRGDAQLEKAAAPYAGEKGNLRFALDRPIPHGLIASIVRHRLEQNRAKAAGRSRAKTASRKRAKIATKGRAKAATTRRRAAPNTKRASRASSKRSAR